MNDDSKKSDDQFDASLPLPTEDTSSKSAPPEDEAKHADASVDLIRKKIDAAYANEPAADVEATDIKRLGDKIERSKHQQFIYELTGSGKPLHEIQMAWHEYYAGLPEAEKHEVWQEFYNTHNRGGHFPALSDDKAEDSEGPKDGGGPKSEDKKNKTSKKLSWPATAPSTSLEKFKRLKRELPKVTTTGPASHLRSVLFGLSVGTIVLFIFLFSFFNERFIAPFIQPSRNVTNTPIIAGATSIGPNPEIIIPKINVEIPVIYDVKTIDEAAVESALNDGVVHYADTAMPGQDGNLVIVGHSSNNIFNPGKYKFAFVLLSRLESGDTFYLQKDGKRYTYQVYKKEIVKPDDVSVLGPNDKPATATLITCDPPGTSTNRLVVVGEQIDPNPIANLAQSTSNKLATESTIIPGNSPSLWSRFVKWLSY